MKRTLLAALLPVVFLSFLFLAGCNQAEPGLRIAVVDTDRVLAESTPGQKSNQYLQAVQRKAQTELKKFSDNLGDLENAENQNRLREMAAELQAEVGEERAKVVTALRDGFSKIIEEFRVESDYDIILDKKQVLAFDVEAEVTERIIREFNKFSLDSAMLPSPIIDGSSN